ncbi:YciI family protein [Leptospira langatensis]|uniref:YciI family protein n=1 Tax=Leptospira langatensis TaxID=2484983 RepID=A0A5F1ZRH8_9LEPT|nr:YciI family protein [Leptospira langatensis]TGK05504.1 YciI family protein [Leptospira langatensis]TGL38640.1 YciI family protein [Leptospira langatensis]
MQYQLLIYVDEKDFADIPQSEFTQTSEDYKIFTENLIKASVFVSGERLHLSSSAATVRSKDGKIVSTHGPFAETKEQLGGFYIIDCKSLEEAIEWASQCPAAKRCAVEVRPIVAMK